MINISEVAGATNQVLSAAKTLSNISPAKALSGISTSIGDTVNAIGKEVTNNIKGLTNIGNIFASVGSEVEESDLELPIPNPLHAYATYNYIFGIGCLSPDDFNFPGSSYMAGKMPPLICKSANAEPNNRVDLEVGKFDFYIDNLVIESTVGFTKVSGNTTNTTLNFKIIEPYSMGMFIQAIQVAAYQQGYNNWQEANYLLTIEFRGNKESGVMEKVRDTEKYICFQFNSFNMKVSEVGSEYFVDAKISSAAAYSNSVREIKTDITISGKTVQEVLQSGPKSLQQVVNAFYKQQKDNKLVSVQDEVLILFPNNVSSEGKGAVLVKPENTESKQTATTNTSNSGLEKLLSTLKVSRSSSTSQLTQLDGTCNALGKASVGFDVTKAGNPPFPEENAVWDDKAKTWVQSDMCSAPNYTDFKFQQSSDIVNIINQVLMKSQAAAEALKPDQIDSKGMRPWWRIDTQVYHISSNENMKTTGELPKLYVYRVIPYQIHASRVMPPNATAPGITELKKEIVKEYNYIYTGKNIDVLSFNFELSNSFYQVFAADNFKNSGDSVAKQQTASSMEKPVAEERKSVQGVPKGQESSLDASRAKYANTLTSSDKKGGAAGDTPATRAAKLFHDAIIDESEMNTLTLDIIGDPYYIASSGTGNYTDNQLSQINITKDGSVNYQNGEVHVIINFRTPSDIDQTTGMYNLKNNSLCARFSGLYKLNTVRSEFTQGQFKQTLDGFRIRGQNNKEPADPNSLFTSDQVPETNKGFNIEEIGKKVTNELNSFIDSLPLIGK